MLEKLCLILSLLLAAAVLLTACGSDAAATATPTIAAPLPDGSSLKVGLVVDSGGVNDHAFNQLAWEGVQKAGADMGFQAQFGAAEQPADYEKKIDAFASEGYNVIIAAGPQLADATAAKARQYPDIKFAIVDYAYVPTPGSPACAETVHDCYADGGLANVTSLMFAEEQAGFLAGVLAGGMSRSGFVCSVAGMRTPASDRYVISFRGGAVWQGGEENMRSMNNYINLQTTNQDVPSFTDATEGKETAQRLIDAGCDVVFGVYADGALLAAKDNNLPALGVDVDQHNTKPAVKDVLVSSALKNVDVAVYNYLRAAAGGAVKGGISTATLQDGGVGLAPFHDWEGKIPADLKTRIQQASDGIKDGSITIDLP